MGDEEREAISRERKRFFALPVDGRATATRSFASDERVYKENKLGPTLLDEAEQFQHAVSAQFVVAAYENSGAVLVRTTANNTLQVLKTKSLHGRCLRSSFNGMVGAQLHTVLLPWSGHIVCCGYANTQSGYSLRLPLKVKLPLLQAYHTASTAGNVILNTLIPAKERPAYAATAKQRGTTFFKKGSLRDALNSYLSGLRVTPDAVDLLSNAALMCIKIGDGNEALQHCRRALSIEPGHTKCQYRSIQAYHLMGLKGDANLCAARFVEAHPGTKEAKDAEEMLVITQGGRSAACSALMEGDVAECLSSFLTLPSAASLCSASQQIRVLYSTHLRRIDVTNLRVFPQAFPHHTLTHISLANCRGVDDRAVQVLLSLCRGLSVLEVVGAPQITDKSVHELLIHTRLQRPSAALLPGMPEGQASLGNLPPLPGMTQAGASGTQPRRRARHREVMFRAPVEDTPTTAMLTSVSLCHCDAVSPTEELDALGLALSLRTTCRPADYVFSAAAGNLWIVSSAHEDASSGNVDVEGRLLHYHAAVLAEKGFTQAPMGAFALQTELPADEAREMLSSMGLRENVALTQLVR